MFADEDDYLSDKFLTDAGSTSSAPKTYAQIRKEVVKKAQLKSEQNRLKGRRQREVEAREEGLSKSLFERAKEEEEAGVSTGSKALSMMMKMGFKPGQSLGQIEETAKEQPEPSPAGSPDADGSKIPPSQDGHSISEKLSRHKIEPLPLHEWSGKKGIGLGKRSRSPTAAERVAKMAKMAKIAEESSHRDYRDRARQEYEDRRAEGRLGPAQRTCITLDEQTGKSFNVLWLNVNSPTSFPAGLADALTLRGHPKIFHESPGETIQARLRRQMQEDALESLRDSETKAIFLETFSSEVVEESIQFLRLQVQDRLHLVLSYLRDKYAYCFWCGVQYENDETMEDQCPGPDEGSHD